MSSTPIPSMMVGRTFVISVKYHPEFKQIPKPAAHAIPTHTKPRIATVNLVCRGLIEPRNMIR